MIRIGQKLSLLGIMLACLLVCSGCFELETEVHFLEDGSGFVTQWVRVDAADASVVAAMSGISLETYKQSVLGDLESLFIDQKQVQLLDRGYVYEPGKLVLRYRFLFHTTQGLNDFLNAPEVGDPLIMPTRGTFTFREQKQGCGGSYHLSFTFLPRPIEIIAHFDAPEIDNLPQAEKDLVIGKFYSGEMRMRVVMPGKTMSHNAIATDGVGNAIYKTSVLQFYRRGLNGQVRSQIKCKDGVPQPGLDPTKTGVPITLGYVPSGDELVRTLGALSAYMDVLLEFDCTKHDTLTLTATFRTKAPFQGPFEFYFPMMFVAFPVIESQYNITTAAPEPGVYQYRFQSKEPIDPVKLGSRYIYYAKQKNYYAFRMKLPKMEFMPPMPEGTESNVLFSVKVMLPDKVRMTNATEVSDKTAVWRITDRMLRENPITLEVLSE